MKSILRYTAAGVALATLGFASNASAATAEAQAHAEILQSLTVTLDAVADTLDFGTIAESGAGGTVTLTSGNGRSCSAGLLCAGSTEVPEFDIAGAPSAAVAISFTNSTIQLTGPGAPMDVVLDSSDDTLNLSGGGVASFTVGGVLTVNPSQVAGAYSGQLLVQVLYN